MTLDEKRSALIRKLEAIPESHERLNVLALEYRTKNLLEPAYRTEAHRVEGCLSKLWFHAHFDKGRCYFQTDSDSLVVKAIAGILCELYSGHLPEEILSTDPGFLKDLGITQHLTINRRNGVSKLWSQIRGFAISKIPGAVPSDLITH